jgi:hypothetical protein
VLGDAIRGRLCIDGYCEMLPYLYPVLSSSTPSRCEIVVFSCSLTTAGATYIPHGSHLSKIEPYRCRSVRLGGAANHDRIRLSVLHRSSCASRNRREVFLSWNSKPSPGTCSKATAGTNLSRRYKADSQLGQWCDFACGHGYLHTAGRSANHKRYQRDTCSPCLTVFVGIF